MIDTSKLIDIPYLLNPHPGYQFALVVPLTIIFSLAFITGILLSLLPSIRKRLWTTALGQWLRWFGAIGLLLVLSRYEGFGYASMRINYYFLTLGFLVWLGFIVRLVRAKPQVTGQTKRQETFDKYLPRPKHQKSRAHTNPT